MNDDAIGWLGFALFSALPVVAGAASGGSPWWSLPFLPAPIVGVAVAFFVMPAGESARPQEGER